MSNNNALNGVLYTTLNSTNINAQTSCSLPIITSTPTMCSQNLQIGNMHVTDIIIQGNSISSTLEKIKNRLAILDDPNPTRLEKFSSLKKAYDNYKILENLVGEDNGSR
jgi:hypothetical protein